MSAEKRDLTLLSVPRVGVQATVESARRGDKGAQERLKYARVVRGPDWKWDEQDGGEGAEGNLLGFDGDGWAKVLWSKARSVASYRFNGSSMDLAVVALQVEWDVAAAERLKESDPELLVGCVVSHNNDVGVVMALKGRDVVVAFDTSPGSFSVRTVAARSVTLKSFAEYGGYYGKLRSIVAIGDLEPLVRLDLIRRRPHKCVR